MTKPGGPRESIVVREGPGPRSKARSSVINFAGGNDQIVFAGKRPMTAARLHTHPVYGSSPGLLISQLTGTGQSEAFSLRLRIKNAGTLCSRRQRWPEFA